MHGENLRNPARGRLAGAMRWFPINQVDSMRVEENKCSICYQYHGSHHGSHEESYFRTCLFSDIVDMSMATKPEAFPNWVAGVPTAVRILYMISEVCYSVHRPRWHVPQYGGFSIPSAPGPCRFRRVYGVSRFGQIETSAAMDAYLLSFSADSLGAHRTNNKFGTYVLMCDTNVCTLNLVS